MDYLGMESEATKISNAFARGEFRGDFEAAIAAIKTAYYYEKSSDDELASPFWDAEISRCDQAKEIYDRHMVVVKEAICAELRQQGLTRFADALESGDYSSFAY